MAHILIIGGDGDAPRAVESFVSRRGHTPTLVRRASEGLTKHRDDGADVVVLCLPLVDGSGDVVLGQLLAQDRRALVVVTGRDDTIGGAADALAGRAVEYIADPAGDTDALQTAIGLSLGARQSDVQLRYLRKKDAAGADWETITGEGAKMRRVFATVRQICHRTAGGNAPTILVTGETGTGKGLIAKAIHYNSARRGRAFVDVNCAAIPAPLIEAELFGHERGAFTDAASARPGLFETADGGTLLLDEIGALHIDLQSRLLTAIEEKTIRRLGSQHTIDVDVQIIAATHRDLEAMVAVREFREDLYHRLNVVCIELPPLRDRGGDKLLLAESFIRTMCQGYGLPIKQLSPAARQAIDDYRWPGNVRELRNQIERIILLEPAEVIDVHHFQFGEGAKTVSIRNDGARLDISLPDEGVSLDDLERAVIDRALEKCAGNVSKAARFLGVSRQTLIYRLKKHGLAYDKLSGVREAG